MVVKLLKETRLGPFGKKIDYTLLNQQYGEWIIFDKNQPLYYLNIFNEKEESSVKIRLLLENKGWSLNLFLHRINISEGLTLTLQPRHFGLLLKKEEIEISLEKFPMNFIQSIEGPYCEICIQGEIIDFSSQAQFDGLDAKIEGRIKDQTTIEQIENIVEKGFTGKKYYKFYCNKCNDYWVLRDFSFPDNGFFIRTRDRDKYNL